MKVFRRIQVLTLRLLLGLMLISALLPETASPEENTENIVRVAYCLSAGYQEGEEGAHKTGYGYEYLQKIARITGWTYQYVYGSFNELLDKLESGEIDLMGNLAYTDERAQQISYGQYEQGLEDINLYAKKNTNLDLTQPTVLNGKRIGVHAETIYESVWLKWRAQNGVECVTVQYPSYEDCCEALKCGDIDAAVSGPPQQEGDYAAWEALLNLGTSPIYFGVNKGRPDLLEALNQAQGEILQQDPTYNRDIYVRYMTPITAETQLDENESKWIRSHTPIKVGYLEGFPPLCYQDEDGTFRGVAADVLSSIEKTYSDEGIRFEAQVYTDYTTMFNDLRDGKISLAWPAYDDAWAAEQYDFIPTKCVVSTPMMLIYDGTYTADTETKLGVINTGSLPKLYAIINYPNSEIREYNSYVSAINAILDKEVTGVLYVATTYNVDVENNSTLRKLSMTILPNSCDISLGIAKKDEKLVSVLNKGIVAFGDAGVNHSLIVHSTGKKKLSLKDYIAQHPYMGIGLTAIVLILIGGIIVFVVLKNTETRVKASQAKREMFERLSNTDLLTGLYNRKAVFRKSREMLNNYPDEQFAMIHVDMVHFRLFNTFFGDAAGDHLLCDIADLFRRMSGDYDHWVYGRIEGDVFCALFPYDEQKYRKQMESLRHFFREYRTDFLIQLKVGMYFITDPKMPIESMFTRASLAAKEVQTNSPLFTVTYNEALERELNEKQQIINDMRTALAQEQFKVYLQPKYSLKTNKMVGAEALVRWFHPTKGIISPGVFIPVFESNGFITELDRYMWDHVCRLLSEWKKQGKLTAPISVNVSRLSMYGTSTVNYLKALLEKYDISPKYLELELTETAYIEDPDEMKAQMLALKDAGFTILLDDFGNGYSSLNTLRELPVDVLKLDMKFLPLSQQDTRAGLVISSVARMSQLLGLVVIAEGVELQEQAEYLKGLGCEYVQGFLFARPMVEDYEKLL